MLEIKINLKTGQIRTYKCIHTHISGCQQYTEMLFIKYMHMQCTYMYTVTTKHRLIPRPWRLGMGLLQMDTCRSRLTDWFLGMKVDVVHAAKVTRQLVHQSLEHCVPDVHKPVYQPIIPNI